MGALAAVAFLYQDLFGIKIDPCEIQPVVIRETSVNMESPELAPAAHSVTALISPESIAEAEHPLDPLLDVARQGFQIVDRDVEDYTATMVKRVFSGGKLQPEQYMACKIRHGRCREQDPIPFSVYMRFLKPKSVAGQEVIWVEGCNDGNLIAHGPTGLLNVVSVHLAPDSSLAMRGNRHTIREIGMLNLVRQMIERGERDRKHGECEVKITRNVMMDSARCTRLEIIHPVPRDHFDFYIAKIYIDDDRNLPIAYECYTWPDREGGPPVLLERYYYTNIKVNVGLTDRDFDPANRDYFFPGTN